MTNPDKTLPVAAQLIRIESVTMNARAALLVGELEEFMTNLIKLHSLVVNLVDDVNSKIQSNTEYFLATDKENND